MPKELFKKGADPRRYTGGRVAGLPTLVRRALGDRVELVAKVFVQALLTGKLSFDSVKKAKVRSIDTAQLAPDKILTPDQYLAFASAAGLIPKHATPEQLDEFKKVIELDYEQRRTA